VRVDLIFAAGGRRTKKTGTKKSKKAKRHRLEF
jgi:hypothetical protein